MIVPPLFHDRDAGWDDVIAPIGVSPVTCLIRRASAALMTRLDALVLSTLGVAGFVGSAGHVLELAEKHGQRGTGAWTVVGTVEVLAAYAGVKVQQREGWRRAVALAILAAAVTFTVAANLAATDDRTVWGMTMSVTPAGVFLAAVILAETADRPARAAAKAARRERRNVARRPTTVPVIPSVAVADVAATATGQDATAGVATVAKPQVSERIATSRATPASAVKLAMAGGQEMAMGEIVLATGRPRATVKKAVGELVIDGVVTANGDPRKPRYRLAIEPVAAATR
jgi:hypothetical protein